VAQNSEGSQSTSNRSAPDMSDGCYGCGCGSCLGSVLMFCIFAGFMIFSNNPPFTQMDIAFDVIVAAGIGGVIGAIGYPLFQHRRRKNRHNKNHKI
jgi:ammonia channel protein AmtB